MVSRAGLGRRTGATDGLPTGYTHRVIRAAGFTTFQDDIQEGRLWPLHRRCSLVPADADIRACERHLRKAGPLSAVRAYRDKRPIKLVSDASLTCRCVHGVGWGKAPHCELVAWPPMRAGMVSLLMWWAMPACHFAAQPAPGTECGHTNRGGVLLATGAESPPAFL